MKKIQFSAKVIKLGTSFGVIIPKFLLKQKLILKGETYLFSVGDIEAATNEGDTHTHTH